MCRCSRAICRFRKATDKHRLLGVCIHGKPGATYDHKTGWSVSPDCEFCANRKEAVK